MIDIAVIGSGPAGLSAAVSALQRNKTVMVFGRHRETSFLYKAEKVDNYLGLPEMTGKEMVDTFYFHALKKGAQFKEGKVLQVFDMGEYFSINAENEFFEAKTIIIATGIIKNKSIAGEDRFLGRGVSYCATCDGMLYRGKDTVVVADNEEGEEEAEFLAGICKSVTYIPKYEMEHSLSDAIRVIHTKALEVLGNETVTALKTEEGEISCQGIFFMKETVPAASLLYGLKMEENTIKINRFCETNLPRVYAAGDCTGRPFQVSKAVGEGLTAALQACSLIDKMKKKEE